MMTKKHALSLFAILSLGLLTGCEESDDQRFLPAERSAVVNPIPAENETAFDFKASNEKHKVLLAVIDSGVDYNHPYLLEHMHFDLDENNQPIGNGFDFIGNDRWPSPYLAASADINPEAPAEKATEAKNVINNITTVLSLIPELSSVVSPLRRLDQEIESGSYHGTHVAGLMTYDVPEIGLLGYRVLPHNVVFKAQEVDASVDQTEIFLNNLENSIKDAAVKGVKVINMSLGMNTERDSKGDNSQDYQEFLKKMGRIEKLVKQNPQIAFVAAAGNDGAWVNERARLQLPCGIKAQNILCVGALDQEGELASFSNILLTNYPYILAPGEEIISTFPMKMCHFESDGMSSETAPLKTAGEESIWASLEKATDFAKTMQQRCTEHNGFVKLSGTSMASPIVARAIGQVFLRFPNASGQEAIQLLLAGGEEYKAGVLTLKKLKIAKPSWYKLEQNLAFATSTISGLKSKYAPKVSEEYFEFVGAKKSKK